MTYQKGILGLEKRTTCRVVHVLLHHAHIQSMIIYNISTHIHTYMHTHMHTYIHTHIHTYTHTHTHTRIHAHAHTHTHTHTYTPTHTQPCPICMNQLSEQSGFEDEELHEPMPPVPYAPPLDVYKLKKCEHMMHRACLLMYTKSSGSKVST